MGREARSDALSVAVVVFDGKAKLSDILAQLGPEDCEVCGLLRLGATGALSLRFRTTWEVLAGPYSSHS